MKLEKLIFEARRDREDLSEHEALLKYILDHREDPVDTMEFYQTILQLEHKFPADEFKAITRALNLLFIAEVPKIDKDGFKTWLRLYEWI